MLGPQVAVLHRRQVRIPGHGARGTGHRGGAEGHQVIHVPPEGIAHNRGDRQVGAGAQQIPEAVAWVKDGESYFVGISVAVVVVVVVIQRWYDWIVSYGCCMALLCVSLGIQSDVVGFQFHLILFVLS